jgi:hypothetical protein
MDGSWDLRRTNRSASPILSASTAAQPFDAAVTAIPPLAHFALAPAPDAALADTPAASGHSSPVAAIHAVNAVADTAEGPGSQSNVGLTCRASGPKFIKDPRAGEGRCAHLQVVELEVALMHRLAAASVLTLHVESEAARRGSTVDAAHRTRRERPWPNPIATRIRLALPAGRAPPSWMGCSSSLCQWGMPRACALAAYRSQLTDQLQQRLHAHLHGTVEVLQCELLFGVTRARSATLSRILAGSAIDAAQHDPLVFSVLIFGDQPLGKGLVQESKPLHGEGALPVHQ